MKHSFKTASGRSAFGKFNEPLDASNYTYNKKAKYLFCNTNLCIPNKRLNTQSNLLLLNRSNYLKYYSCTNSFNTANLNVNLLTALDLSGIPVLINQNAPPPPSNTNPGLFTQNDIPYIDYTIDPCGNLFGYTACGLNNYELYLRYNPPPPLLQTKKD
jgi:hypothetical protein